MKNEPLTGYLLHARPYQETRAIYYLFSQEHGVVHGVGKRGLPEFAKLSLFATGKGGLKNFKDVSIVSAIYPKRHYYYALLYLNEVLYRLLVPENPCLGLWQVYQDSLEQIDQLTGGGDDMPLRLILRNFERALFVELGVELDFDKIIWGKTSWRTVIMGLFLILVLLKTVYHHSLYIGGKIYKLWQPPNKTPKFIAIN